VDCEFAPWEKQYGFNNDRVLKNERSRIGEHRIRQRAGSSAVQRDVLLLSRAQWQERGRTVLAGAAPSRVVETRAGNPLRLFSLQQTS
jgi:hypothetical protein